MSLHCCAIGLDLSPTFAGVAVHWQRRSDSDIQVSLLSLPVSFGTTTLAFKRNHDKLSYYFTLGAKPLREHVKLRSRHTRWVAGSTKLSAYSFPQTPLNRSLCPL